MRATGSPWLYRSPLGGERLWGTPSAQVAQQDAGSQTGEMAQWLRYLPHNPDRLPSIPVTHTMEEEN